MIASNLFCVAFNQYYGMQVDISKVGTTGSYGVICMIQPSFLFLQGFVSAHGCIGIIQTEKELKSTENGICSNSGMFFGNLPS